MKPYHLFWSVLFFALGVVTVLNETWRIFGYVMWAIGFTVWMWIVIAGLWDARALYLDSLAHVLRYSKDVDIDKMIALELASHPDQLKGKVHVDLHEGYKSTHFDLPVSPAKLQVLASGLLSGRPFAERPWKTVFSSNEFRTLRGVMKDKGLIVPVSEKDARQGYTLSDAGRKFMRDVLPHPADV